MKILIIEDDNDFVDSLKKIVLTISDQAHITSTNNLTKAIDLIKNIFFDLIILDLNIPVTEYSLDGDPSHGHSAFTNARLEAPGTPVIVLTGSSAEDFIDSMLRMGERTDIWGGGIPMQLVAFHPKHKLDSFPKTLKEYTSNILSLRDIELQRNNLDLSEAEDRLIRIFTRRVNGVLCNIEKISSGLSDSNVFRLTITNDGGGLVHDTVCKIAKANLIIDENNRYTRYISRLKPEATPRKLAALEHGAKNIAGVFYGLADGFSQNAFSTEPMSLYSETMISALASLLHNWRTDNQERIPIADIRRRVLDDTNLNQISADHDISWLVNFEAQKIQVKWGCAHGDLHGLNILISNSRTPILIDYGDAGDGPSSLDPITLEFSIFFHPDGPLRDSDWPTEDQSRNWGDLGMYLVNCPFPDFVKACRSWALEVAAGEREVAAVAYSYFVRQLKYKTTNHARSLSLIEGAKIYYDKT